ncbi:restriction endonuclease subunit S [Spirulina sp.]|uniref:restriction endonuclease subunit S n=1 Tax=Spirulina sp. TaxID=1157 RepID=UPI003F6E829B
MKYETHFLGNIVTMKGGGTPSKKIESYWNGDIPWASVKDLTGLILSKTQDYITQAGLENSSSNLIPAESIIIATRMAVGRVCINKIPVAINQDLRALFCSEKVVSKYLIWFLLSSKHLLEKQASGATVKGITLDAIKNLEIPLPPIAEQKRIAAILDKADDIRRKRSHAIQLTEELGRSLFLDMFGDPVTNPKGWELETLENVLSVVSGQVDPKTKPYIDMPHIGGENLKSNTNKIKNVKTPRELHLKSGKYVFEPGDVLYSKIRPYLNQVVVLDFRGVCSADIYPLRVKQEKMNNDFLVYLLRSRFGSALMHGTEENQATQLR